MDKQLEMPTKRKLYFFNKRYLSHLHAVSIVEKLVER